MIGFLEHTCLEDHPTNRNDIVSNCGDRKSPIPGGIPLLNGLFLWLMNGGDPNYLLTPWSKYMANRPPKR